MIEPLFGGKTAIELLHILAVGMDGHGYALVRDTWKKLIPGVGFEKKWREVLHDGLLSGSALPVATPTGGWPRRTLRHSPDLIQSSVGSLDNLELSLRLSPAVYDGRFANNGWLQELPDPITKLTWDNAALMSPQTAQELSVTSGDVVEISHEGRTLEIPVWIQPGHADYSITIPLGYGRTAAGRVGNNVGFSAYSLRSSGSQPLLTGNVDIRKTGRRHEFASTQNHGSMEGRPIVREATVEQYLDDPRFAEKMVEHPPLRSLSGEHKYDTGYQWGMTIDLTACIGCNACTIACQSENNIPIVGKEQVTNGREMHWMRIDRYYNGDPHDPEIVFQPIPCQQCENAPCETVCPVAATVHDKEGLNQMTYNRCIGTRYCSNNCPYKVRRFNFFNYTKDLTDVARLGQNPDVTVRSRGVMEKCTFCIQRINRAKQQAKKEGRQVRDGEILTACQQTCPTRAIQFGNIIDPESKVTESKMTDCNYHLLAELNVRPRNSYLARIRNPNPALAGNEAKG
jgi:molybdopterin-containing oxidoreductase family iron-sulfur binding subunit